MSQLRLQVALLFMTSALTLSISFRQTDCWFALITFGVVTACGQRDQYLTASVDKRGLHACDAAMSPQCLNARTLLRNLKRFKTRLVAVSLHEAPVWPQTAGAIRQFSYSYAVAAGDTSGASISANDGGAYDPKNTTICLEHPSFTVWGANTGAVTPCLSGAGHLGHHALNRLYQVICSLMRWWKHSDP